MDQISFLISQFPKYKLTDTNKYEVIFESILNQSYFSNLEKIEYRFYLYNVISKAYENKINSISDIEALLIELNEYANINFFKFAKVQYEPEAILQVIDFIIKNCFSDSLRNNNDAINLLVSKNIFSVIIGNNYDSFNKIPFRYKNYGTGYTGIQNGVLLSPTEYASFFAANYDLNVPHKCKLVYKFFVPDVYKENPEFIKALCSHKKYVLCSIIKYAKKTPGLAEDIINEDPDYYKKIINRLPANLRDYVLKGNKNSLNDAPDKITWLENNTHSTLYEKLEASYKKAFLERHPDYDQNDKINFLYTLFQSNVIEEIYKNDYYDNNDICFITAFLNYLDRFAGKAYSTASIREKMETLHRKYAIYYNKLFNDLTNSTNTPDTINTILSNFKINRGNAFHFVLNQKYWLSGQKSAILKVFNKHFSVFTTLTIFDVIDIKQKVKENHKNKVAVLNDMNFNYRDYERGYEFLKEKEPKLIELTNTDIDLINLKRALKLYYAIMNYEITNKKDFTEKFGKTPEEVITLFESYQIQYSSINQKLVMITDN